jgi:hypothetical protein
LNSSSSRRRASDREARFVLGGYNFGVKRVAKS